MLILYSDYRVPVQFYQLLIGPIATIKSSIQACFVLFMYETPSIQITSLILLETAMLIFTIKCSIKASVALRTVDYCISGLQISYLLLKLLTTFDFVTQEGKQENIGIIMAVLLYGMMAVSILFAVYSLILILFRLLKRAVLWLKNRKLSKGKVLPISNSSPEIGAESKIHLETIRAKTEKGTPLDSKDLMSPKNLNSLNNLQAGRSFIKRKKMTSST